MEIYAQQQQQYEIQNQPQLYAQTNSNANGVTHDISEADMIDSTAIMPDEHSQHEHNTQIQVSPHQSHSSSTLPSYLQPGPSLLSVPSIPTAPIHHAVLIPSLPDQQVSQSGIQPHFDYNLLLDTILDNSNTMNEMVQMQRRQMELISELQKTLIKLTNEVDIVKQSQRELLVMQNNGIQVTSENNTNKGMLTFKFEVL